MLPTRAPLAFAIVLVPLAAACGGGSGSGSSGSQTAEVGDAAQICVDTINELRATMDLPAYERWSDGESCASTEAEMDSDSGTAHGAFGMCGEHAQDECPGWPSPASKSIVSCLQMMWAEGPGTDFASHGHYINMSSTKYTKVACGFFVLSDGKSLWAAQNFE